MKDGAHDTAMAELFQEDAAFATQYLNDVLAQGDQADLLIALRQMKDRVRDPVKVAYLRFCDKLRRKGLPRVSTEGPVDYARRVEAARPDLTPAVSSITRLYIALRYGAETGAAALAELQQRVRRFTA